LFATTLGAAIGMAWTGTSEPATVAMAMPATSICLKMLLITMSPIDWVERFVSHSLKAMRRIDIRLLVLTEINNTTFCLNPKLTKRLSKYL
jgi:hypothetical protein